MINRIDNTINQNNYKPYFGTTVGLIDKLPVHISNNKLVSKSMDEITGPLRNNLINNHTLDHLKIKFKLVRKSFKEKYIRLESSARDSQGKIKKFEPLDLFVYNKKTGEINKTNLMDIVEHQGLAKTIEGDHFLHSNTYKTNVIDVSIMMSKIWRNKKIKGTTEEFKRAIETIKRKNTGATLIIDSEPLKHPTNPQLGCLGIKMKLISGTTNINDFEIQNSTLFHVFEYDKDRQLRSMVPEKHAYEFFMNRFRSLQTSLENKINPNIIHK